MTQKWSDLPIVTCPHCGEKFQLDDYWNLSVGDTFDCNECEKEIYVLQIDTIATVCLGTKKED